MTEIIETEAETVEEVEAVIETVEAVEVETIEASIEELPPVSDKKFYTDNAFTILFGDDRRSPAPIREVKIVEYDHDYTHVEVDGLYSSIQTRLIYLEPKRFGETPSITKDDIT